MGVLCCCLFWELLGCKAIKPEAHFGSFQHAIFARNAKLVFGVWRLVHSDSVFCGCHMQAHAVPRSLLCDSVFYFFTNVV